MKTCQIKKDHRGFLDKLVTSSLMYIILTKTYTRPFKKVTDLIKWRCLDQLSRVLNVFLKIKFD